MHRKKSPGSISNGVRLFQAWIGNCSLVRRARSNSKIRSKDGWECIEIRRGPWIPDQVKSPKTSSPTQPLSLFRVEVSYLEIQLNPLSAFVQWHSEADRYLGPQECHGKVRNTLVKILPLEPGFPQMPSDIRYTMWSDDFGGSGRAGHCGGGWWVFLLV